MNRITSTALSEWVQPKAMQRRYELRLGDETIADLTFKKSFGSLATATAGDESWSLKRVGFFNPTVTIREEGAETDLAVYKPKWFGTEGVIEFTAGNTFRWKPANFWATQYEVQDASGAELVLFKQGAADSKLADIFKLQARVEVQPAGEGAPELLLLVILGWYIMILQYEDSAAATAAAAAAS